jgi:hypothetical protein
MLRLKSSLLLACAAGLCFAQDAADLESRPVKKVAAHFACGCGCKTNMACDMPGPCGTCRAAKTKIFQMQQAGLSEKQIVNKFVEENGKDILLAEPGAFAFAGPYVALALGLGAIVWWLRRSRKAAVTPEGQVADPQMLDRYHDQIERETSKLE